GVVADFGVENHGNAAQMIGHVGGGGGGVFPDGDECAVGKGESAPGGLAGFGGAGFGESGESFVEGCEIFGVLQRKETSQRVGGDGFAPIGLELAHGLADRVVEIIIGGLGLGGHDNFDDAAVGEIAGSADGFEADARAIVGGLGF